MDIAISKESVCLSVHRLKHYSFILYFYTPDIRSMFKPPTYEIYGVIMFSLFRSSICSYVCSFIFFPSQGQRSCVKVYRTSYFEDLLMDFIHIWHDGRYRSKVFISTIPIPGISLESRSQNFHKKVKVFCVYIAISSKPLKNFIYI